MPQGSKVVPRYLLKGLAFFSKIWSNCVPGQIAFSNMSCHSGRFLAGDVSFVENLYLFPLSIVLSGHLSSHDHYSALPTQVLLEASVRLEVLAIVESFCGG